MDDTDVAELFGTTKGYKASEPNIQNDAGSLKKTSDGFPIRSREKVADLLVELGVKYEYESTKVPYVIQHTYTPDFILPNGVWLECKGYWDSADRKKVKSVIEQNPDIDLRMVFQAPYNTISKKSKTTYAKWCERHGIKWTSFATIPIQWLI